MNGENSRMSHFVLWLPFITRVENDDLGIGNPLWQQNGIASEELLLLCPDLFMLVTRHDLI